MNLTPYILIYIGSIFFVLAAYFHLSFKEWTLKRALITALPLVFIEYCFLLPGNHKAKEELLLNPIQILVIMLVFNFINLWIFNRFVSKSKLNYKREILAFGFIIAAFLTSQNLIMNKNSTIELESNIKK